MLLLLLLLFAIPMVQMLLERFSRLGLVSLPSFDGKGAMVQSSRQTHHSPPPLYEISLKFFLYEITEFNQVKTKWHEITDFSKPY
jgi:hypothetical protein